jgi:hypothetical protein
MNNGMGSKSAGIALEPSKMKLMGIENSNMNE